MTETSAPVVQTIPFDYRSDQDVEVLTHLFRDYLLEGLDRVGHFPSGIPLADWLKTFILNVDGQPIGFCSADLTRYAIELIYVAPDHRRLGVARRVLLDLNDSCPRQMRIKAPLSAACESLVEQLGIPVSRPTPAEEAKGDHAVADLHKAIQQHCQHRRVGSPQRPCHRCYQACLRRMAVAMVADPCMAVRNAERVLQGGRW